MPISYFRRDRFAYVVQSTVDSGEFQESWLLQDFDRAAPGSVNESRHSSMVHTQIQYTSNNTTDNQNRLDSTVVVYHGDPFTHHSILTCLTLAVELPS